MYYLQLRRFRRLDRVAVETDEIEDVPVRSPKQQVNESKAKEKSFPLMLRTAPGDQFLTSNELYG